MGFKFIVVTYRLLFALIILAAVAWQLSDGAFGPGFSFVNFFSFFTILSNLFLAAIFIASAWVGRRGRLTVGLRGAAVLYMAVTGIVYAVFLQPAEVSGGLVIPWVNIILHQVAPAIALIDWLLVPPRVKISRRMVAAWLVFPLTYLAYTLVRGPFAHWYPYPFLDPRNDGYLTLAIYVAVVACCFLVLGAMFAWTGNRMRTYARLHPRHYPHFNDSNVPAVDWHGVTKKHLAMLLVVILITVTIISIWAGWRMWRSYQIDTSQQISTTSDPDILKQTSIYKGDFFDGQASYAATNNQNIDSTIHKIVDDNFQPCRRAGIEHRYEPEYICQADFKIVYQTEKYLAIAYTFMANNSVNNINLTFDNKTGEQIKITDLFNGDSKPLEALSKDARQALQKQFADVYKKDPASKITMEKSTEPQDVNFTNFSLTSDEKLLIYFAAGKVTADTQGTTHISIGLDAIYGILKPQIIADFFPKFEAKKAEERKQAEIARKAAQAAELARQHARSLVAPNRSNIDCSSMKCLALTFDDGPSAYTGQVLDMLKARQAVASFFVLGGSVSRNPSVLQRIVNEKSEVANHSWSHANLTGLSNQSIADEVELTNSAIHSAIGVYPKLFRPPYGAYDNRVIANVGMPIAMWSIDPNDWKRPGSAAICQSIVGNARPGAVALLHDIHPGSVAAVPCILDELQRQGYAFVTMSELFGIDSSNVQSYSGHVLRRR